MTIDELERYIAARASLYRRSGNAIEVEGCLDLSRLTTLPEGVTLTAGGSLDLGDLTTLPEGVTLTAGRSLYLSRLTSLPEGVTLTAGGSLDLRSLTSLPEGVTLTAGGSLDLRSLTTLPEGVTLTAGGFLDLGSLTSETQRYQGKTIRLRTIDGLCTRLICARKVGEMTVWSGQYFKGNLDTDPRVYVAQHGDDYAHGDTAKKALRDLRLKVDQRDLDLDELVADIKRRGVVTFNDYRLLTGACESGLTEGLRALGKDGAEEMPLSEALALCAGAYGGDTFRRLMGVTA